MSEAYAPQPLEGIVVAEFGRRIAVGAAGSLLAQLGASVYLVETGLPVEGEFEDKFVHRDIFAFGKHSLRWNGTADDACLTAQLSCADVIIASPDADQVELPALGISSIVCDITAFGVSGLEKGTPPVPDHMLQAIGGIADTTGESAGPPLFVGAPVVEFSTGVYAAAAIIAALRLRRQTGLTQHIDMSLYDCAVNAMATFFPAHFGGGKPRRLGNRHSMAAPWNAYKASDGWVLLCAASDAHWQKICEVIGRPALGRDLRYGSLGDRMTRRDEVDSIVAAWIECHPVDECIALLNAARIACGPIVPVGALSEELNLRHRHMLHAAMAPDGRRLLLPGNLFNPGEASYGTGKIPELGSANAVLRDCRSESSVAPAPASVQSNPRLPLHGIRVVELGQYTTAPLAGRHLAALGAEVIKIEPLDGDSARQWAPHRDGMSYFFVLSNAGKRPVGVDLRSKEGLAFFTRLLKSADVLIENMKPGSLARLGFSGEAITAINPRLIYSAITGFGSNSAYKERPAFDTVVQAMSGLMDLTRFGETPLKAGISIADISGGQLGLLATLAGLELRDKSGRSPHYDLSMQDVAAWLTQLHWNGVRPHRGTIVADCGGYSAVDAGGNTMPVLDVAGVAASARTAARDLIVKSSDDAAWPLLGSPLRLDATSPRIGAAIGHPEPLSQSLEIALGLREERARINRGRA